MNINNILDKELKFLGEKFPNVKLHDFKKSKVVENLSEYDKQDAANNIIKNMQNILQKLKNYENNRNNK